MTRHDKKFTRFITCEGGEGSGKSTLIQKLNTALEQQGYEVVLTREPGGSPLGNQIRSWLLSHDPNIRIGNKSELLLFLAARAQHLEELVLPALNSGKVVLCDRFQDSTIVYQGIARGLGLDYVQKLCTLACDGIQPGLTLFLDVDPSVGLKRAKRVRKTDTANGETDRIESETLEFHERVRQGFLTLAEKEPDRFYRIDAMQSPEVVFSEALKAVEQCLTRFST